MGIIIIVFLFAVLTFSSYTDLKERKIPNTFIYISIGIIILIRLFHHPQGITSYIWGTVPAIITVIIYIFSNHSPIGGGDIKLLIFMGITLGGFNITLTIIYSFVIILLYSVIVVFLNKKAASLPLAPFLLLGTLLLFTQSYWFSFLV